MLHDPELVAETKAWLARAQTDIRAAAHDWTAEPPLVEDIVFHAQQAVEKCFKGFLTWHGVPFRKIHNLEELGESCLRLDSSLKSLADKAIPLTEYAWKFRYPGELDVPSREEAAEAVAIAQEVYEGLLTRLPEEVRP